MLCFQSSNVINMDMNQEDRGIMPGMSRNIFIITAFKMALGLTQSAIQLDVTTQLHLVTRLKMCAAILPLMA